jgi:hypothetical protein
MENKMLKGYKITRATKATVVVGIIVVQAPNDSVAKLDVDRLKSMGFNLTDLSKDDVREVVKLANKD